MPGSDSCESIIYHLFNITFLNGETGEYVHRGLSGKMKRLSATIVTVIPAFVCGSCNYPALRFCSFSDFCGRQGCDGYSRSCPQTHCAARDCFPVRFAYCFLP